MQQLVKILCMAHRAVSSGNRVRQCVQTLEFWFYPKLIVYFQRRTIILNGVWTDQLLLFLFESYNLLSQVLIVNVGKFQFTFEFFTQFVEPQFILPVIADLFFSWSSESSDLL